MDTNAYKPKRFWVLVYVFTWALWFAAAYLSRVQTGDGYTVFMVLGIMVPAVTSLLLILFSKNRALKKEYGKKLVTFRVKDSLRGIGVIAVCFGVIVASIYISTLFGQSTDQLALTEDFSFSIGSVPTLLTLIIAACLEEIGWRGYGFDSLAQNRSLFSATAIFAALWAVWHVPLFFIEGSYQNGVAQQSIWFAVNFLVSTIPLSILLNWLYVKSNKSILICILFHFAVNILQEAIAMTQVTKSIQTVVLSVIAAILVYRDRSLFFERHEPAIASTNER